MKIALVTGASSGIGLMYARELARTYKYDLLLVSNQEKEIVETAETIAAEFGVTTIPLYRDLSLQNAAEELHDYCHKNNLTVEVLINNAGVFFFNYLNDTNLRRIELMVMLHTVTTTKLCKLFGDEMCQRGHGYILNMSSLAGAMSIPGIQCYCATKAYLWNLSKSLWYEYMPKGVHIMALCPGAVDTGLYGLSDYWRRVAVKIRVSIPPEKLVRIALRKLFKSKKKTLMPGFFNHLFKPMAAHLPDWIINLLINNLKQFMK